MANKVSQLYNDLPSWSKGIVAVLGVGAIVYIGYTLYANSKKRKEIKEANKAAEDAKKEIDVLRKSGVRPSYANSQYEVFAQKLVQAMTGCGTSEDSIYSVFSSMRNKADVLSLISAFGVRFYQPCAASQPISYVLWLRDDKAFGGSLETWLQYDLSTSEIKKINDILRKNNINYTF